MKLNSDSQTLAESKALILYILDKVAKPICSDALLRLVLSAEEMNYFYFQQFLIDLIDTKYIVSYVQDNETLYELTTAGKEAVNYTMDLIPGVYRLKVDSNLKENLMKIENDMSITADYIPHNENEYSVKCKIVENNQTLFEIQAYAGTKEQAKKIADNWTKNASEIYPQLLDILRK